MYPADKLSLLVAQMPKRASRLPTLLDPAMTFYSYRLCPYSYCLPLFLSSEPLFYRLYPYSIVCTLILSSVPFFAVVLSYGETMNDDCAFLSTIPEATSPLPLLTSHSRVAGDEFNEAYSDGTRGVTC